MRALYEGQKGEGSMSMRIANLFVSSTPSQTRNSVSVSVAKPASAIFSPSSQTHPIQPQI